MATATAIARIALILIPLMAGGPELDRRPINNYIIGFARIWRQEPGNSPQRPLRIDRFGGETPLRSRLRRGGERVGRSVRTAETAGAAAVLVRPATRSGPLEQAPVLDRPSRGAGPPDRGRRGRGDRVARAPVGRGSDPGGARADG